MNLKKKLLSYKKYLKRRSAKQIELRKRVKSGELAVIPIGFRCYTNMIIEEKWDVSQASLPFTHGFFPPYSVASILCEPEINLKYNDDGLTHRVCIKSSGNDDPLHGKGIKFELSSYDEINSLAADKTCPEINQYLDSTFGYYTLDMKHKYVLAHYNWHHFANESKSKGITDPRENLQMINKILNKRIERMFDLCDRAKEIFFVVGETQNYKYMQIGAEYFPLDDYTELKQVLAEKFNTDFSIIDITDESAWEN